ncbi:MAG: T9SS type A sorting domain-containing protein [Bacteroidota bacterium]
MLRAQISLLLFLLFSALNISAATITWVGGNGEWDDPSMWDSGAVPTATDDVVLANGSISMYSNASARSILIESSATFILTASAQFTILPTTAVDIPVEVRGKVNVAGRLRVLNQLGFTDYDYIKIFNGVWQTEPGGEVLLDGGGLHLADTNGRFNNRGYLWMERTSNSFFRSLSVTGIFINDSSGQVDIIANPPQSFISAVVYISPAGQLVNHGVLEVETSGGEELVNENRLDNWGQLNLHGLNLRNKDGADLTNRHRGQIRIQNLAPIGFNFINEEGAHVINHGHVYIGNNTNAAAAVLNNGRFDNRSNGYVRLYGQYSYQQIRIGDAGEWYNHGYLNCGNRTSDDQQAIWNKGDFHNYAGGRVRVQGTHQESALKNTGYFLNEGYLDANDLIDNQNVVENASCGEVKARAGITNTSVWLNDGWLRYIGTISFSNSGYFQHTGLIEDPNNNINPNDIVNEGVLAQTKTQPVFVGENPNFLVLGEWWQVVTNGLVYHEPEGEEIGEYDPSTNVFNAWSRAEGLQEVFFLAEASNGNCATWFRVEIDGEITEAPRPFTADTSSPKPAYDLRVYPNPSTDFIRVYTPTQEESNAPHWCIYNQQGQLLDQGVFSELTSTQIDLTSLPPATYLLQLQDATGHHLGSEQIIKQ